MLYLASKRNPHSGPHPPACRLVAEGGAERSKKIRQAFRARKARGTPNLNPALRVGHPPGHLLERFLRERACCVPIE